MIKSPDIRRFIADKLKQAGFNIIASDIQEGFPKPAVFIYVYPSSIVAAGEDLEDDVYSVTIMYIPAAETAQDCAVAAEKIREALFYNTVDIDNRHLTVEEMEMNIEDAILNVVFDISVTQTVERDKTEYETAENIEIGGI